MIDQFDILVTENNDDVTVNVTNNLEEVVDIFVAEAGEEIELNITNNIVELNIIRGAVNLSLTTNNNSGPATYDNITGVLNIPQYTLTGLGATTVGSNLVTLENPNTTSFIRINANNTVQALGAVAFRTAIGAGTITSVGLTSSTSGVTIGSSPITTSGNITLAIATASGSQQGLLSATDWTTFNNKQNALTNPITGTGANGQVAFWNGTNTQTGDSGLVWDNVNKRLGINRAVPSSTLDVNGNIFVNNNVRLNNNSGAITNGTGNQLLFFSDTLSELRLVSPYASGFISFNNGSPITEKMRLFSTGNLLIGTTTDAGFRLDVNGTARISGLTTIQGTTASDTAPLGAELLTTGTGDASWTGTSFATGYTHVVGSVTTLTSAVAAVINTYYQITYTVTGRTSGSFTIAFGGNTTGALISTGNTSQVATTTGTLVITPTSDFNGTIVLSIRTIGTSSASVTFNNSSGTTTNQIRISSLNNNTFIGLNAGSRNTLGFNNSFYGANAGVNNTTAESNSAFGSNALTSNTMGSFNVAIGSSSLNNNTTGQQNVAIGAGALQNNNSSLLVAVGFFALRFNTTGQGNTAIGSHALGSNTTGQSNTALGWNALANNITGISNTAIGHQALQSNTGTSNTAVGTGALHSSGNINNNIAIGNNAVYFLTSGGNNTIIGTAAGRVTSTNAIGTNISNSVLIGNDARTLADNETNVIVIGNTGRSLGSNTTVLGNTSTLSTAIYGDLLLGQTTDNGTDRLQITGTARVSSSITAGSFIRSGGTSSEFLKADGSVDSNTYALSSALANLVTTNTTQTITGIKVFNDFRLQLAAAGTSQPTVFQNASSVSVGSGGYNTLGFNSNSDLFFNDGTNNSVVLSFSNTTTRTYNLPDASGTLAFTSQIPSVSGTTNFLPKFTGASTLGNSLIFDNGTNVGIGTTSPSVFALVDANGQFRVSNLSVQGFYQARTSDTVSQGVFGGNSFVLRNGATSEDLNFDIFNRSTSAWYTPMVIKNTGNVGIGTTAAVLNGVVTIAQRTASGDGSNTLAFNHFNANNNYINFGWYGTSLGSISQRDGSQIVFNAPNGLFLNTTGGNVGIGTTSPTSRLHVTGLPEYATNALAISGGLTVGAFYHTAGVLKVVI